MKIHIYVLIDPRFPTDFRYVGQTKNLKKRLAGHLTKSSLLYLTYKNNWINKIISEGVKPEIKIIDDCEFEQANDNEIYWIQRLKDEGHKLTNLNRGGRNFSRKPGYKLAHDTKQKISKSLNGHSVSKDTRAKLSKAHTGKKLSDETKQKMSDYRKGKPFSGTRSSEFGPMSDETKQKIGSKLKGHIFGDRLTEEGRIKISNRHKGRIKSDEEKQKISVANKGKIKSEETCKKLSDIWLRNSEPRHTQKHTEETKKLLSEKMSGVNHPQYGKKRSEETKKKIRETKAKNKKHD